MNNQVDGRHQKIHVPLVPSSKKVTTSASISALTSSVQKAGGEAIPDEITRPPFTGGASKDSGGLYYERMQFGVVCGDNNYELDEDIGGEQIYEETFH